MITSASFVAALSAFLPASTAVHSATGTVPRADERVRRAWHSFVETAREREAFLRSQTLELTALPFARANGAEQSLERTRAEFRASAERWTHWRVDLGRRFGLGVTDELSSELATRLDVEEPARLIVSDGRERLSLVRRQAYQAWSGTLAPLDRGDDIQDPLLLAAGVDADLFGLSLDTLTPVRCDEVVGGRGERLWILARASGESELETVVMITGEGAQRLPLFVRTQRMTRARWDACTTVYRAGELDSWQGVGPTRESNVETTQVVRGWLLPRKLTVDRAVAWLSVDLGGGGTRAAAHFDPRRAPPESAGSTLQAWDERAGKPLELD